MAYLGNQPVVGDSANTFKVLDDITSFTVTFDATSSDVVSIANDTLTFSNHRFITGQKVTYNDGGGTAIGGLADGSYFIIKVDQSTIKLASSASNAAAGTAINLTSGAAGGSHTLNIAFDGVNTKFKATHTNGTKSKVNAAAQLSLSINGVIQQPTVGYDIEPDSVISFSTAPVATDKVFGSFIGEVATNFDISDNTVDEFTGDGSTTTFTLSKKVSSNGDLLVTLDGVVQYPSSSTTRAYNTTDNTIVFTSAPASGVIIQIRHLGFPGASSGAVTAFYGRTGNTSLADSDALKGDAILVTNTVGIQSGGVAIGTSRTLNFIGTGNTVIVNSDAIDISIAGGGGGAVGAGTDKIFYENDQTVTQSYTISAGKNAMAAGPLAVASGQTITIPSGSELTIV